MRTTRGVAIVAAPLASLSGRRRQRTFEKQARRGLATGRLPGHQNIGRLRSDVQHERIDVVGRQRVVDSHKPRLARLPARPTCADLLGQRGPPTGRTRARQPARRVAEAHVDRNLASGGRVVAHLDVELRAALRAGRVSIDAKNRQIRRRLGRGGRFELDLRVAGQRREVGLRPVRSLEIADDDQLPPAMVALGSGRQHPCGHVQRAIHVGSFGQRTTPGQLVAQGVEIGRRAVENATRPCAGQDQVGRQSGPIAEIICGHGPRPLDLLDRADAGRHALTHVEQHDPHGVAPLEIGDLQRLAPLRPRHGQGDQQHGQRPQGQQHEIAQPPPGPLLANGLADESQRRQRQPHGPRPRQPVDQHGSRRRCDADPDGPRMKECHGCWYVRTRAALPAATKKPPNVCK